MPRGGDGKASTIAAGLYIGSRTAGANDALSPSKHRMGVTTWRRASPNLQIAALQAPLTRGHIEDEVLVISAV